MPCLGTERRAKSDVVGKCMSSQPNRYVTAIGKFRAKVWKTAKS